MATIEMTTSGFRVKRGWFNQDIVDWKRVVKIDGRKINKVNYEELFLIFFQPRRKAVPVGELDDNFMILEDRLAQNFTAFPDEWRVVLDDSGAGQHIELWKR